MNNKLAFKIALGGVITSLCLFFMFCSGFLPMLDYTIPTFAGFLMVIMIVETNAGWAFTTYVAVSLLSLLITPNIQASLLFVIFMGYYPILKYFLDKLKNRPLAWAIKLIAFNAAVVLFYILFQFVFMTEDLLEGLESFGKYAEAVLLLGANVFFLIYDRLIGQLTGIYVNWFRRRILRRK
ncbi:MAG: hypothetical protein IKN66_07150 [Ruminococcus sp.]|nr:hypothetical protein [Ruminococcus sp.]